MSAEYPLSENILKTVNNLVAILDDLQNESTEEPSKSGSLFKLKIDEDLRKLFVKVVYCTSMERKVIIYAFMIFDRLNSVIGGLFLRGYRKMALLTSLLIALKYNVDAIVQTEDYCDLFGISVVAMNKAEMFAYRALKFRLYVSEEEFLRYEENVC